MVFKDIERILASIELDPAETARLQREEREALEIMLEIIRPEEHMVTISNMFQKIGGSEKQALLSDVIQQSEASEKQALLSDVIDGIDPDQLGQILAKLKPEQRHQLIHKMQEQDQPGRPSAN